MDLDCTMGVGEEKVSELVTMNVYRRLKDTGSYSVSYRVTMVTESNLNT